MKDGLLIDKFNRFERIEEGNRFLIGNGHLGYRGVLEEEDKTSLKGFNLVGVYDKYGDKWRESINMPDPLLFKTFVNGVEETVTTIEPLSHHLFLSYVDGILYRDSEFPSYSIHSERFLSKSKDDLLCAYIRIEAKKEADFRFHYGLDTEIYEINGPHFVKKSVTSEGSYLLFEGQSNEGKRLYEAVLYRSSDDDACLSGSFFSSSLHLKEGEHFDLVIYSFIYEEKADFKKDIEEAYRKGYAKNKEEHIGIFSKLYEHAKVRIKGDEEAEEESSYAIYELLILGDERRARSIPARGVSGETYKGAIFWDSEIFLLPFFAFNEPEVARNIILYRINTLEGAKQKAKELGYEGAFYAWESQDSGLEACSKYNVTDYKTGKPIRTYFNEKQIHISADIVYALENYLKITGDETILENGGYNLLIECCNFFMSYAKKESDGKYHFLDVIGPDEYHERVDDNAFTNYMVHHAFLFTIECLEKKREILEKYLQKLAEFKDFAKNIFLPKPNENGVIEQFRGYFQKEDCTLEEVKKRVKDPRQYWGGEDGPASSTQIIKQADVVAMLSLLSDEFDLEVKKANYVYYFPRTEHGSSLSSSMYSLLATEIGEKEYAYKMFRKSASTDLYGPQKNFAGGIYIGGSHPASAGGAYMSLLYGWSALKVDKEGNVTVSSRLPDEVDTLDYKIKVRNKEYSITVNKKEAKAEAKE